LSGKEKIMRRFHAMCLVAFLWPMNVGAGSLRVAPVLLDVMEPTSATKLELRNGGSSDARVQIRVFKWTQDVRGDQLAPTEDVVVSPPMMALPAGAEYVVRVIRVTNRPVDAEESYRVLVDELPGLEQRRNGTVSMVVRQSIPVFFSRPGAASANVTWSIASNGSTYVIDAANSGGKRLRIASLIVATRQGALLAQESGLVGYILSGSRVSWSVPARRVAGYAEFLRLTADTELDPIDVTTKPLAAR
jgi:fimbrial chaperone protein